MVELTKLALPSTAVHFSSRYDFDVEGNGAFRLFPSGTNSYAEGSEVLNSYGRRPNDNLLLDYGFAMLDNEWDTAEVVCSLSRSDQALLDKRREAYLHSSRQHTVRWVLAAAHLLTHIFLLATHRQFIGRLRGAPLF